MSVPVPRPDPLPRLRGVAVTGASSGLGAALALAVAAPGRVLWLHGRDAARLAAVAARCRAAGAEVREALFDVRDAAACAGWVEGMTRDGGRLDLMVANAGVSGGSGGGAEPPKQAARIFAVNLLGALNTILPAMAAMRAQAPGSDGVRGRVAAVSSLAAFVNSPGAPAYCASKAALQRWAESTDCSSRRDGVRVFAVCPGYVRTPMTAANPFPMPGLMDADEAARRVLRGLAGDRSRVAFPRPVYWMARLAGMAPARWLSALPAKPPTSAP